MCLKLVKPGDCAGRRELISENRLSEFSMDRRVPVIKGTKSGRSYDQTQSLARHQRQYASCPEYRD